MEDKILLGRGQQFLELTPAMWKKHLSQVPQYNQPRLSFMTEAHYRVRYFVVKKLLDKQAPVDPEFIATMLTMPLAKVNAILEEMEKKLFFLVRDEHGAVNWAYPVTLARTPHRLSFSTGAGCYAASADDAIASAFVQGRLRNEYTSVDIETTCAHCDKVMHISTDSNMRSDVREIGASPLVFIPEVDWTNFSDTTIIEAYCQKSVFFWSEAHARLHRLQAEQVNGVYLTLEQCAYTTPVTQGTLFAFDRE